MPFEENYFHDILEGFATKAESLMLPALVSFPTPARLGRDEGEEGPALRSLGLGIFVEFSRKSFRSKTAQ